MSKLLPEQSIQALSCLLEGFRRLPSAEFRGLVFAPILINLTLYAVGFWLASHFAATAMAHFLPAWLDWLRWLLWPILLVVLLMLAFSTFTLVTNLLAAPFYGLLAERAQTVFGGSVREGAPREMLLEMRQSLAAQAARTGYFILRALPLSALSLVPVVNLVAAWFWMGFAAWSLALDYMSYPLELRGMSFREQREALGQTRLPMLVFGAVVLFFLTIPVLNVLVPPAAVIGASLYWSRRETPEPKR